MPKMIVDGITSTRRGVADVRDGMVHRSMFELLDDYPMLYGGHIGLSGAAIMRYSLPPLDEETLNDWVRQGWSLQDIYA